MYNFKCIDLKPLLIFIDWRLCTSLQSTLLNLRTDEIRINHQKSFLSVVSIFNYFCVAKSPQKTPEWLSYKSLLLFLQDGPINPAEICPLIPPQSGERWKSPETDLTRIFLDVLLELMVTQVCIFVGSSCAVYREKCRRILLWAIWQHNEPTDLFIRLNALLFTCLGLICEIWMQRKNWIFNYCSVQSFVHGSKTRFNFW